MCKTYTRRWKYYTGRLLFLYSIYEIHLDWWDWYRSRVGDHTPPSSLFSSPLLTPPLPLPTLLASLMPTPCLTVMLYANMCLRTKRICTNNYNILWCGLAKHTRTWNHWEVKGCFNMQCTWWSDGFQPAHSWVLMLSSSLASTFLPSPLLFSPPLLSSPLHFVFERSGHCMKTP